MKVLFLSLLFAWFLVSTCGQKNDNRTHNDVMILDSLNNFITLRDDSILIIHGDTTAAIKSALRAYKICYDRVELYREQMIFYYKNRPERLDTAKLKW